MGSSAQNMRFLRSFMVLGAVVVLTLFIYASYNSSRIFELPHIRNVAPPSAITQNENNHSSSFKDSKNTLNGKSTKVYFNAAKHMVIGPNHIVQHGMKNSDSVGHHRQPTVDVDAVVELDAEVDTLLEDHDLTDQQFADNNLTTNISAVPLQQSQLENKNNKIVESDFLIPTSNLQKFIENADKILKNLTAAASIDAKSVETNLTSTNKENNPEPSRNVQSIIAATPLVTSINKNAKINNNNVTTTIAISAAASASKLGVIVDPAQGIPTKQIYESGHRDEELNIDQICPEAGKDLKLLIVITSAQLHQEARLAIRQTWGHYGTRRDVATLFILGRTTNESINTALVQENFIYGDLIRGNFLDTYNNLTLKTISALEWVDRHCFLAKHILKTDDDMFINVPNLLAFLEIHGKEKRTIYGRLAKKWKPIRNKKSKYYVSPGQFAATIYPAFTTGPAYVVTSDIVHELYERSLQQTYLKLEDVFTTGIVAQQLGIKRVHVNEFLNRRIAFNPCNIRKTISVHMIKANEQFDLWKKLLDQTTKCK